VPVICKVAPSVPDVHLEDVHRAGGVMAILGELHRANLLNRGLPMVHSKSLEDALGRWDIKQTKSESVRKFFMAAPGNVPTQVAFSQERRFEELDTPTVRRAVSATSSMRFQRMVASRCCPAIWPWTAAS
jgi:dihydroxy-acid dehydratase